MVISVRWQIHMTNPDQLGVGYPLSMTSQASHLVPLCPLRRAVAASKRFQFLSSSTKKSTKKRSRKKVDQQEVEPVEPKDAKKKRKAKTSDQTKAPERKRKVKTAAAESGAVASALGGTEAAPAVDPATERKKRLSRRSSAYHVAKKRALAAGKSAEEATALAKEVAGPNQKKVMSQIGSVQNRIKFGIHPILRYF